MSKKNKFNIIFFNIILISTLHSATDYANDDNDENIVRMLNETIQENVISKMNCEIFDNNNIQKLADFLNKTNNQCYKNLKFYQIDYNTKKDISERWSFRHIHKKSPSEENRSGSLVNHFNQSNDFNFAQSFFFVILLSEAGYVLNEEASLDKKANDELSRILDTLPVLAPCANNHISWTKKLILVPDFYILFDQRTDIETLLNTDLPPFQERKNTIFFSGAISGWPHPFTMENIQNIPRFHLLDYADTHEFIEYKMTNSNHLTKEHITNPEVIEWFNEKHSNKAARQCNYIDHAQYKYLLSFDGFGAAWGRIPSILSSGSVLLMQSECNQWFYSRLKAYDPFTAEAPVLDENFIIVSRDLSNLEDLYNWLEANPEQAEQLGKNGKKLASNFFRTESNFNYLLQTLQQVKKRHSIFYLNNMHHKDLIYTITKKIANSEYDEIEKAEYDRIIKVINKKFLISENSNFTEYSVTATSAQISGYKIPPKTHRIWLTDPLNPSEIPEDKLDFYEKSLQFNLGQKHHFWCIDKNSIPESIVRIESMGVEIHEISEIQNDFITINLFNKLITDNLYGFASNLARFEILNLNGGRYDDIGLEQTRDLSSMFFKYDALFYIKNYGELDVCSMGFPKDSPFLKEHLEFIRDLSTKYLYLKDIEMGTCPKQAFTTSYGMMARLPYFARENQHLSIGFLQQDKDFIYHGMRKWRSQEVKSKIEQSPNYFFEF